MMNTMNKFTEWLNEWLEKYNWSYSKLAREAGTSKGTVSYVMSGQQAPSYEFCTKVAKAIDLPPSLVLRKAGLLDPPNQNPTYQQIMEIVGDMTLAEQREILRFVLFRRQHDDDLLPDLSSNT